MPESVVLLTDLIVENPLCLGCIAKRTGLTTEAAETALTVIERALRVHREARRCRSCGVPETVYLLERPSPLAEQL